MAREVAVVHHSDRRTDVARLATHPRCKIEITAIAVAEGRP